MTPRLREASSRRGLALVALGLAAFASTRASAQLPADRATPLPPEVARVADAIPNEGTPDPGEHYPVSNERSHGLWAEPLRDLGGAFVGVGTDQCYTLAAMQNAELLWLVDFDPLVPVVHQIYGVLIPASGSPLELVARFSPAGASASEALLGAQITNAEQRERALSAFRRHRAQMYAYLQSAQRNVRGDVGTSWLSDSALYERVRALHRGRRVIARNGDVTADGALRAVGRASRQLGVPVRVVYFSNAEQFFPFGEGFRANLAGLLVDERSIVLRTFRARDVPYPLRERWHYMVQPVSDLRARIEESGYRHSRELVRDLLAAPRFVGRNGSSVLDARVPRWRRSRDRER
jgi:hypothetical protein